MKKGNAVFYAASIAILALLVMYINPSAVWQVMSSSSPEYIAYAFIVSNIALFSRVLKWKVLLHGVSVSETAPVQFFGIAASNLTPGKIGEPVKSVALKLVKKIPVSTSLPAVIWERIADVLVMMLFAVFGFYIIASTEYIALFFGAIILFSFLIIMLVAMMCSKRFGMAVFGILRKMPVLEKISESFMRNFYSVSGISKTSFLKCMFFTFVAWVCDGIVFYLVYVSVFFPAMSSAMPVFDTGTALAMTSMLSISILMGIASSLPGGLGGTEAVLVFLLTVFGLTGAAAGSVVIIGRMLTFGYSILLGYISFIWLGKRIDMRSIKNILWN